MKYTINPFRSSVLLNFFFFTCYHEGPTSSSSTWQNKRRYTTILQALWSRQRRATVFVDFFSYHWFAQKNILVTCSFCHDVVLRYVGRLFVKGGGKPSEILTKLNEMAGFSPNEEIELYEVTVWLDCNFSSYVDSFSW